MTITKQPQQLQRIMERAEQLNFTMSCDIETGQILRTLAASKPNGQFLELGTGAGVSTVWILEGMDSNSHLISVEMDEDVQDIARACIEDNRVQFVTKDGGVFIEEQKEIKFDFIFADTWPGKYYALEETLTMVKPGGFYIIDDLNPVDTWPEGHGEKAKNLIQYMREHDEFHIVELNWSTGLIIATKRQIH